MACLSMNIIPQPENGGVLGQSLPHTVQLRGGFAPIAQLQPANGGRYKMRIRRFKRLHHSSLTGFGRGASRACTPKATRPAQASLAQR